MKLAPTKVKVTIQKIEILDKVYFETAKATIKPESFPLLDEVARVLIDYPQITKVRVEGHTDSRGNDAYNLKLSDERAAPCGPTSRGRASRRPADEPGLRRDAAGGSAERGRGLGQEPARRVRDRRAEDGVTAPPPPAGRRGALGEPGLGFHASGCSYPRRRTP